MRRRPLNKRTRAQVVTLLRCAADNLTPTSDGAWTDAVQRLGADGIVEAVAGQAYGAVADGRLLVGGIDIDLGRVIYLEAAQRVEEGTWP